MRERIDEVGQPRESGAVDLHRPHRLAQHDGVLVVVLVGRVLQEPSLAAELHGDQAQILPGRVIGSAGVALIVPNQEVRRVRLVFRTAYLPGGLGDVARVFLGFGQVDGDVHPAVDGVLLPADVLCGTAGSDVVARHRDSVEVIRGRGGVLLVQGPEPLAEHRGVHDERAHDSGVPQVAFGGCVGFDKAPRRCVVEERSEQVVDREVGTIRGGTIRCLGRQVVVLDLQDLDDAIADVCPVPGFDQPLRDSVVDQVADGGLDHACSHAGAGLAFNSPASVISRAPASGRTTKKRGSRPVASV